VHPRLVPQEAGHGKTIYQETLEGVNCTWDLELCVQRVSSGRVEPYDEGNPDDRRALEAKTNSYPIAER